MLQTHLIRKQINNYQDISNMSTDKDTLFTILVNIKETYFQEAIYDHMVKSQFKEYCNQQTQRLQYAEFKKFIDNKTDGINDAQIQALFKIFDKNRSGTISYEEFTAIFAQIRHIKSDEIKKLLSQKSVNSQGSNQSSQQQFVPTYNVRQEINPITNQRNINIDLYVKDTKQVQDLNLDLKISQQQTGQMEIQPQLYMNQMNPQGYGYPPFQQNQGIPQQQYVPNPLMDDDDDIKQSSNTNKYPNLYSPFNNQPYKDSPQHYNPQNQQVPSQQIWRDSPQFRNSPQHYQPSNQIVQNNQNQRDSPHNLHLNQQGINPQQQLPSYNSPAHLQYRDSPQHQHFQQQQQQIPTQVQSNQQGNNISKYPSLNKPGIQNEQEVVNGLIGNNEPDVPLNKKDEDRIVQELVPETNFDSLMIKLETLKQMHLKNQINLFNLKNISNASKITFRDLTKFINSSGVQLTQQEEQFLKAALVDKNSETVYIKDFLNLLGVKELSQNKKKDVIPTVNVNQQKQPNIIYPPLNINSPVNQLPQQELVNQKQGNNIPAQNFLQVQNNKNNIEASQKLFDVAGGQKIDVMRSSIQTRNLYEIDTKSKGFDNFVRKFKEYQQQNKPFTDSEFQPVPDSIIRDSSFRKYYEWRELSWKRPAQIFGHNNYQMFQKMESMNTSRIGLGKLIAPQDIEQGQLGDCYFLSAVSSLAQEPQRIMNLFITRIKNNIGMYCVRICFDGEWTAVYVDDFIPCNRRDTPAFTKASGEEIWVLILEKAWAKLFKSYYSIEAGYCREALRDLTGAPTKSVMTLETEYDDFGKPQKRPNESLPIILKEALSKQNKFVVTAGADDEDDLTRSTADRLGLVNSHAYSIIGVKEITHPKLGNVTLLRLRNPWANQEWKGDWSDDSPCWTPELRDQLRVKNVDDGIFYMSVKDFMKYFDDVCICYYHDDYQYNSIRINNSTAKRSAYTRLRIEKEGTYYISIIQPNKRHFENVSNYKYSCSRLFISQVTGPDGKPNQRYIGAIQKRDREIFVECNLTPGNYLIQSKIFWETNAANSYVVSTYGVAQTKLDQVDKNQVPPFMNECLIQKARKSTKLKQLRQYPEILKEILLEVKEGFGYYYVQNNSSKTLDMEVNFTQSDSIKLRKPNRMPILKFVVPPKTEFIAPFTVSFKGYNFKSSESYTVS
ncbi:calpain family cysteine protease (macronuclear) [Tetrahymena thermophila SB210]|uniref:Calpain family cysteine protease n=1 Tax=Tetrahymena thermophila (strain SB210) TaxID=312017 RepID=Q239Z2_TETTS|nr:calpain family cysteine protease [Tetrahymena thermophila SB210]EAR93371.2 calpain family cysteine protease [Tetrahymena thermophila SB210]|eukprot:XP_001013616.2 calpain family cysteine protease [Tetrahymena thermophila SB210]